MDRSLGGEQWRSPGALHVPSVLRLFGLEAHEAEAVEGTKFARADCAAAGEEAGEAAAGHEKAREVRVSCGRSYWLVGGRVLAREE